MTSILLYAELLVNIKTVSLAASLATEHNDGTTAEISADGETITVRHEGESAQLTLPLKISTSGPVTLDLPDQPSQTLLLRLNVDEQTPQLRSYDDLVDARTANPVPWNAFTLDAECVLQCSRCTRVLVTQDTIRTWKDLPSENWAEMMDFWHCHKPDEKPGDDGAPARKGYAAGVKLVAAAGAGYVDAMYFLFTTEDCDGIQYAETIPSSRAQPEVRCGNCQSILGSYDASANGVRLLKSAITIHRKGNEERYDLQLWIAAQLLGIVESTGARKFIVRDQAVSAPPEQALMLWLFTPDLTFSSSARSGDRNDPSRAMKVFWTLTDEPEHVLATQSASFEEVLLPAEHFASLKGTLDANGQLLPVDARSFGHWSVSLLLRFPREMLVVATG